jgi:hypothetical protein
MFNNGVNIDMFTVNGTVGKVRAMARKGPLVSTMSLELYPGVTTPPLKETCLEDEGIMKEYLTIASGNEGSRKIKFDFKDKDSSEPLVHTFNPPESNSSIGIEGVKEVVLPFSLDGEGHSRGDLEPILERAGLSETKIYGVFAATKSIETAVETETKETTKVRLFPGNSQNVVGLVLKVNDLDKAEEYLISKGIDYNRLGNERTDLELQILGSPLVEAVDMRLSQTDKVNAFYREGERVLLEGTIASIQNSRVLAGDDKNNTDNDSRMLKGDCWSEARAGAIEQIMGKKSKKKEIKPSSNYSMNE